MKVWVGGRVLGAHEATVSALDHGLTVGDGVFETCAVDDGVPFALTRHLRRLRASASGLGIAVPPQETVRAAVADLLAAAPDAGRLRITVTAGPGPLGSDRSRSEPTLVMAAAHADPWPTPVVVVSVPWPRNERSAVSGLKTTSYAENVVALERAHSDGAHEALMANTRGELCEGTGSNVVVAVGGVLVTPPLTSGCLAGITRALALEWATDAGLHLIEGALAFDVVATCTEMALLSSTRDVQPVDVVDGRRLGPPALLPALVAEFDRRRARDVDP